jgi:hypothetical protein
LKQLLLRVALLLLLIPVTAQAAVTTGTIQVIVTDASGAVLPGVTVTAHASDTTTQRTEVTNEQGVATIVALEPSSKYLVESVLEGLGTAKNANVLVKSAQTTTVRVTLSMAAVSESITVTAETPLVDTTSASAGQELTLELTESLPTGRSYQSYLQLVPGVMPDDPGQQGNPASRSGMNYSDIGGDVGVSTDNLYYIEGINVTDPETGTFGANLNTEIIQEQKVLTGGIPAEFAGAPGLLSSVVTKSGGNEISGSVNYYTQNDSLVAENEHQGESTFATYDAAFTLGGPIVRDKAWFFGSYRITEREDDVTSQDTNELLRTVSNEGQQAFGKLSWQITASDRLSGTYTNDPTEISGRRDRDILNTRDRRTEQGGDRYIVDYNRVFSSGFLASAAFGEHNGEVSIFSAINEMNHTVVFRGEDDASLADQQLGGEGNMNIDERDSEFMRAAGETIFDSPFGSHTLKFGGEAENHIQFRDENYVGGAQYTSLGARYAGQGISAADLSNDSWTSLQFDVENDFSFLLDNINESNDRAYFYGLLDLNHDGTITQAEAGQAIVFNSTTGNPHGMVNYDRTLQVSAGEQLTKSKGLSFYLQDTIQTGKWAFNLGVRTEEWKHFATNGDEIASFDWTFAPRLSAVYDILGNGRQKVSAYYGRYYDPIRLNMTAFAGTLDGRVLEEQVFIGDRWITYRTRGGSTQQDAFFAPTTKTPYTDEYQISYQVDLGANMSFETNLVRRHTRDILEDYDLGLYTDPESAGDLALDLSYFGYDEVPDSNYVLATLAGGKRDYDGLDLIFRKRFANNWQALASYTWSDAKGNTNSDSNADYQGDVLFLDPRAPNAYGRQPGSIEHLFKFAGSYRAFDRLELGAVYAWNSGTAASRTFRTSGRNLPLRVAPGEAYEWGGVTARWLADDSIGSLTNPSYGTLDLRAQWNQPVAFAKLELFLDVFNALNDQATIRNQDLVAGNGGSDFGEPISWVSPRRFYLGARMLF